MHKYYEYMNYLYKVILKGSKILSFIVFGKWFNIKQYQQSDQSLASKFIKGYEDCLQNPLQPLMDNLESQVYECFEKDPVKYQQYQKAIAQALVDRVSQEEKLTKET